MTQSCGTIRCCYHGSCIPGRGHGVTLEEPAAVILHGGVCEGGDLKTAKVDLNAHEAGNGGQKPRKAYSLLSLLYSEAHASRAPSPTLLHGTLAIPPLACGSRDPYLPVFCTG